MTPDQACVYCGAPLSPQASVCDACGQPVPAQDEPSPEVPESYTAQPAPAEISPPQPPPAAPARDEAIPRPQPPVSPPQAPARRNGLRFTLILVFILIMICCCILIAVVLLVYNLQYTSLMQAGWIAAAATLSA